jgi:hypothetical protein
MLAETRSRKDSLVVVALNGGRVTKAFRDALFAAADRAGVSVNELVLTAAGDRLREQGHEFPSVFGSPDERLPGDRLSIAAKVSG